MKATDRSDYWRRRYKSAKALIQAKRGLRICPTCGLEISPTVHGKRRYCSPKCRQVAKRRRNPEVYRAATNRWQKEHGEERRRYLREYMRAYRAKDKASVSGGGDKPKQP